MGMASYFDAVYLIVAGDSSYDIAAANGISLSDFCTCATLIADYYVCMGVGGSATTAPLPTTTKGNVVTTRTSI